MTPASRSRSPIPTGSSTTQIGTLLENKGVISSAVVFQYYVKFKDAGPFKAGEYDGSRSTTR